METSLVAKIIRWRIYLQAFDMTIKHIKGSDNGTADWLSRIHSVEFETEVSLLAGIKDDLHDSDSITSPVYAHCVNVLKEYMVVKWVILEQSVLSSYLINTSLLMECLKKRWPTWYQSVHTVKRYA
jgi:hypothetical protein